MKRKLAGFKQHNQRRDIRRGMACVRFVVGGQTYPVEDLSMGGFSLSGETSNLWGGHEILITEVQAGDGPRVRLNAAAEIVRVDAKSDKISGRFGTLTSKQFDIVEALMMGRPLVRKPQVEKKRKGLMGLFSR